MMMQLPVCPTWAGGVLKSIALVVVGRRSLVRRPLSQCMARVLRDLPMQGRVRADPSRRSGPFVLGKMSAAICCLGRYWTLA